MAKRYRLQEVEQTWGQLEKVIPELLNNKHNGNQKAVAQELGVAHSTITLWLKNNGFKRRTVWTKETA